MSGVSSTGFSTKTYNDVLNDINADQLSTVDATLDLSPTQPLGQINGTFAKKVSELWDLGQIIYNQLNPDGADGVSLDNISSITGTVRKTSTNTKVGVTLNLNSSITVPISSQGCVLGHPENPFTLDATITSVAAGTYTSTMTAINAGPLFVGAGTLTQILTPVNGWNSVTNTTDGATGLAAETDTQLRVRRVSELFTQGGSTVDAIRSKVLAVKGVIAAIVRENATDLSVDPEGGSYPMTPHSIEVIVWDGAVPAAANNDIAQAIWNGKDAGINVISLSNTQTGTAVDKNGVNHTVSFTRATQVPIYLSYGLTSNASKFIGDSALAAAIAQLAATVQQLGVSVIAAYYEGLPLQQLALANSTILVPTGVTDVVNFALGQAPSPTLDNNILFNTRSIAVISSGNIAIAP